MPIDNPEDLHDCPQKKDGLNANMQFDDETGQGYCGWCGKKVEWTKYFQEVYGLDHKEDVTKMTDEMKEVVKDED